MYQALYRKYRPTTFDDVIGQEIVIKTLKNAISNNMLTHAYLFTGPRGTGKTSVAKIFAKTINCNEKENLTPCNICVNCTQIIKNQNTDIIELDAASNNGVDEIRELKNKINLVPATAKYKVYIIDEVHMLTTGAFNALLKTLEEPPAHIIFILATTEPHKIPATILSRCQRFDFKKIKEIQIKEGLENVCIKENIKFKSTALREISRLCDGGMRDALSLLDQAIAYTDSELTEEDIHLINGTLTQHDLKKLVIELAQKNITGVLKKIDNYNENGKNLIKIAEELIIFLRNLLLKDKASGYFKESDLNHDIYQSINVNSDSVYNIMYELNSTIKDMKKSNNPKIIFELTIIKLCSNDTKQIEINESKEEIEKVVVQSKKDSINQKFSNPTEIKELKPEKSEKNSNFEILHEEETEEKNVNKEKLIELQKVRVNNTLSNFKRQYLEETKKNLEKIRPFVLDTGYSQFASIILDGSIKAASDEYIIIVYQAEPIVELFNESLLKIEKIFEKAYKKKYKLISVTEKEWTKIKVEFNNKTKEYTYLKEPFELKDVIEIKEIKKDDNVRNLFGSLVEYD